MQSVLKLSKQTHMSMKSYVSNILSLNLQRTSHEEINNKESKYITMFFYK